MAITAEQQACRISGAVKSIEKMAQAALGIFAEEAQKRKTFNCTLVLARGQLEAVRTRLPSWKAAIFRKEMDISDAEETLESLESLFAFLLTCVEDHFNNHSAVARHALFPRAESGNV